jgi:hypothetical protein
MSEQNRDDETRALPVDDAQRLPVEDETQQLPATSGREAADAGRGDTRRLPVSDDTRPLPGESSAGSSSRPDDPLAIFDEPQRTGRPTSEAAPTAPADGTPLESVPPERRGPRTATIVWGFLVLALGVGLLADAAGARIDVELAAIVLLGLAGAVLVLGSLVSAVRRRRG